MSCQAIAPNPCGYNNPINSNACGQTQSQSCGASNAAQGGCGASVSALFDLSLLLSLLEEQGNKSQSIDDLRNKLEARGINPADALSQLQAIDPNITAQTPLYASDIKAMMG